MTAPARPRAWMPRATTQFARTVYAELKRAGHAKGDVLRFINELMDQLTRDTEDAPPVVAPVLVDPEGGLPHAATMHDIVEFELRIRRKDRRSDERLMVAAIDVVVPAWVSGAARQQLHEHLYPAIQSTLRFGDSLGQLGPDRYLLVLPRSKDAVTVSMQGRITRSLEALDARDLAGIAIEMRWAGGGHDERDATTAVELLDQCFASRPVRLPLAVGSGPPAAPPPARARPRPTAALELVVALGGGAARAASHAGVLEVLAAAGLSTVAFAGCSAGALVGAMAARGMPPAAIVARFRDFTTTSVYLDMRRAYATFLRENRSQTSQTRTRYFAASHLAFHSDTAASALSASLLDAFVEHFVGSDCDLSRMRLPFSVVATDLIEGRPIQLSHGSLNEALAASCAVPGLFPPRAIGGRLLVDGSTLVEIPITSAELLGQSAAVLAVHLGRAAPRIADYRTSAEVSMRINALIHAELVREQLRRADLLLVVPMDGIGWLDFRRADQIVDLGRRAATEAVPRIIAQLEQRQAARSSGPLDHDTVAP